MTIRVKTDTGLLCAYKSCLRHPRRPEMTFVVRGRYRLGPGLPVELRRSDEIPEALIEKTRKDSERAARELEDASLTLGQGAVSGERFDDADEEQAGALLYPGDFADYKPKADVLLRGTCHPPRRGDTECDVSFAVGDWKKTLKVVGHRVWVDRAMGGKHTDPTPIGAIAIDHPHAYGGPGFRDNPVGKGHVEPGEGPVEDIYQPPRTERSAVMAMKQLANVVHEDGKPHRGGIAASFAPLSPSWRFRADKLGKKYDQEWLDTRAPCFAADMDWTYFNAAPPDQQIDYLRGDEELTFENLHPKRSRFSVRLPGLRVRVFVRDVEENAREIAMKLDTLFADLEDGSLYLTWRGVTPVKEEDLTDVEFGLVVTEPLADAPRPAKGYLADLEAFAADPIGLKEAFPAGLIDLGERVEKLEDASEAELEAMLENAEGNSPPVAMMKSLFGPLAPPRLDAIDRVWAKATQQKGVDPAALRANVKGGLKQSVQGGGRGGVGLRMPVKSGEKPIFPIGNLVREQEKKLLAIKKSLPADAGPGPGAKIDAALVKLRTNPEVLAADPHYRPFSETDPPPDEPGPGADLRGRDLSHRDLRGIDLSGADLQCAILTRTNLQGAKLTGAKLGGARLDLADLTDADLTDADLTSASFDRVTARGTKLIGTILDMFRATSSDFTEASFARSTGLLGTFSRSVFTRADFTKAKLELCSFDVCELEGVRLSARLEHVRFDDCQGKGVVLEGAELVGASFNDCKLPGVAASKVTGEGAIFFRTELQKGVFHRADLKASHFFGVDAVEANFGQANLPGVRFDRAILRQATFERANLLEADLRKAVLTKTSFHRAILHGAKLTETAGADVDFTDAVVEGANLQRSTITTVGVRPGGGPR